MRRLLFFFLCVAAFAAGPVMAQQPATPPATERAPAAVEDARSIARLIFVESGVFDYAIDVALGQQLPEVRAQWVQSPGYRRLSPERQAALDQYFDELDDVIREEINRAMPQLIDGGATITLNTFSDAEIAEIAPFLRQDVVRDSLFRALTAGVNAASKNEDDPGPALPSPQELQAFEEFARTPVGRVFEARVEPWMVELGGAIRINLASVGPAVMLRVQDDVCALMGPQCPRQLRRQPSPT